jgi:hypothetical protein
MKFGTTSQFLFLILGQLGHVLESAKYIQVRKSANFGTSTTTFLTARYSTSLGTPFLHFATFGGVRAEVDMNMHARAKNGNPTQRAW